MRIEFDAHAHVYPAHDAAAAFEAAVARLESPWRALLLTEARGCSFFRDLAAGRRACPGWTVTAFARDPAAVRVERAADRAGVVLVAGRQVVARERVEILAWGCDADLADGRPAADTVEAVLAVGGIPALAWAPGKWMFARAAVVSALLDRFPPRLLWLCDSSLRPPGWPEPDAMRRARAEGRPLLAGSDPLPFLGEERRQGQYRTRMDGPLDEERPAASLLELAGRPGAAVVAGHRSGWLEMAARLRRHAAAKRVPGP